MRAMTNNSSGSCRLQVSHPRTRLLERCARRGNPPSGATPRPDRHCEELNQSPKRRGNLLVTTILILSLTIFSQSAFASGPQKPKVVMVIAERLELSDINAKDTPNLFRLANKEALGLVALQKAFAYKNVNAAFYATAGAGSAASGMELPSWHCAPSISGQTKPEILSGRAYHTALVNKYKNTLASFGALGQALHSAGLKTAAIGKIASNKPDTDFLNVVMDSSGKINYIAVSQDTDIAKEFKRISPKASFTVLSLGSKAQRQTGENDKIVGSIEQTLSSQDLLIVLMPFSKASMGYGFSGQSITKGEPLSPVIIKGSGFNGILKSPTTRRYGVINASDLMPTILKHLKVGTKIKYTARAAYAEPFSGEKIPYLENIAEKAVRHDAFMLPVLFFMGISGLAVIALTLAALLTPWHKKLNRPLRTLLVATFLFPAGLSILALFDIKTLAGNIVFIVGFLALSAPLVLAARNKYWPLILALGITPFLMIVDLFSGQVIANNSLLGNSLLSGGRYYGLGNQYLGLIFIFTVLLFIFLGLSKPDVFKDVVSRTIVALTFALLIISFGLPGLGANFGGLITLAASLPLVYFKLVSEEKLGRKHFVFFGGLALVSIFGFTLIDVIQKPLAQSHIGRSFSLISPNSFSLAANIIKMKIAHNLEETYMVLFKWGALPALAVIGALFYVSRDKLPRAAEAFPLFGRLLSAISLAAIIAFLYNDTGFEPAAIILLYTFAAYLYLCLSIQSETA